MRLTTEDRRAHYDTFVSQVITMCRVNGIRADLASGRGRPVEDCTRLPEHLTRHIAGFAAPRAHYTVAALIAMQRDLISEDGPYRPESATTSSPPRRPSHSTKPGSCNAQPSDAPDHSAMPLEQAVSSPAQAWRSRPNLGTSLALAVKRHGFDETRMTGHLKVLTRSPTPILHPMLFRLTARLHDRGAARLDFAVLLEDLAWWDYDHKTNAARWRDSYFTTLHTHTPEN